MARKKYTAEEDPLGAFKGADGNSSEEDKVRYKMMRGEDLSTAEWKIYRNMLANDPYTQMNKGYEVAPF